ncbi:GGDEF domain-containing protein [Ferrimonas lipolytica]|uniref:diguanylate cyclase n=1 Tax=Ferrimonas lipolytica TaxID=2724191 RepID=A0A6H1UGR3_9GAMM|nr:GGDEF domain-containing protein [Ferrimonas lipolytica]QIZ76982.1 GGDEF domain-containing protein [Ferrimonas lipolytica]
MSITPLTAQPVATEFHWLNYLTDAAIVHLDGEVFACNESGRSFLSDPQVKSKLRTVSDVSNQLFVSDQGLPWMVESKWLEQHQSWLTQLRPALEPNFGQLLLENPRPILVHDNFKPLFANQAYVDLFQLSSIKQLLKMDSIRPLIGEEHWPAALSNYQQLMSDGYLVSEPVSVSWSCMGNKLQTRIHDFVVDWFGRRVLCTTIHDVGRDQNTIGRYRDMAFTDPLTRLGNRRRFDEQGASDLLHCLNRNRVATVVVIDIDRFKLVNQQYGRPVGDLVLQFLAKLLRGYAGEQALVTRMKQDEFALFFAAESAQAGLEWVNHLKQRIDSSPFMLPSGATIDIELSIGVSLWSGGDDHLSGMHERATQALVQASELGGNQIIAG